MRQAQGPGDVYLPLDRRRNDVIMTSLDLTPYIASVEDSLAAAAAAGDQGTQRTATALTAALEPATRLAIMNALSDLALEVTENLGDRLVELRLEGGEVRVSVTPALGLHEQDREEASEPAETGGEPSRITLRLAESLKADAERSAALQGISLNSWLTRAIQASLGRGSKHSGHPPEPQGQRLRGWVQA